MCGISGILSKHLSLNETGKKMIESQTHRGPDNHDHYSDEYVFLGHNRLSIIDLSSEANQPMTDSDERFWIIYNGEIYNYLEIKSEFSPKLNLRHHQIQKFC